MSAAYSRWSFAAALGAGGFLRGADLDAGLRSNEVLNRLRAEELVRFVAAVEPGALYIHHEDCCGYDVYQEIWKQRCAQCRRRWPNDSLKAYDGGAGAFAHSYSNLIEAVRVLHHCRLLWAPT